MPGRLMDHHARPEPDDGDERQFKRQRTDVSGVAQPNGVVKTEPNDEQQQQQQHPQDQSQACPADGDSAVVLAKASLNDVYPNIEHITAGFHPLSMLYQRIAQECATDLGDLLDNMPSASSAPPQTNGFSSPPQQQQPQQQSQILPPLSAGDAQRKRMWLDFAKKHRDRFTKALVLTRWSAQAKEASRLIDISNWLYFQMMHYDATLNRLADIKRYMSGLKIPSPDIETAVDVLSKGSVSRMPHLGYIPPQPLSAAKLLKNLRNINTLLHIRLTRDEHVPPHLRNYRIHSGRVTFTAAGEFELDVSIADEDAASQFYLIDLRLLFTPTTDIPANLLHGTLEPRANAVLAKEGLHGCFQLLRDLVLTHKINVLRRQAHQLNAKSWAGSLRVEAAHRSLIIQYWKERPGGKNWIEIGVKSGLGDSDEEDDEDEHSPGLGYRCFRGGKEVAGVDIDLHPTELDVERILNSAIAQHMSHLLSQIKGAGASEKLPPVLHSSNTDPRHCSLDISYSGSFGPRSISLMVEALSGRLVLRPWSGAGVRYQDMLNRLRDAASEAWPHILRFQSAEMQHEAEEFASHGGLEILQDVDPRSAFATALRARFFSLPGLPPGPWAAAWIMSADRSCSWKVVELELHASGTSTVKRRLDLTEQYPVSAARQLARDATRKVLLHALVDQLDVAGALYSTTSSSSSGSSSNGHDMSVTIERQSLMHDTGYSSKLWACEDVVLDILAPPALQSTTTDRAIASTRHISHVLYGKLRLSNAMRDALRSAGAFTQEFRDDGTFGLFLSHDLGSKGVVADAMTRLQGLQRLCALVATLCAARLQPLRADLDQVDFAYDGDGPERLKASILFGSAASQRLSLSLEPTHNPHRRILHFLDDRLNESAAADPLSQFDSLLASLESTLPVLRALQTIEKHDAKAEAVVSARQLCCYRLTYPRLQMSLEIRMRWRRQRLYWSVGEVEAELVTKTADQEKARQSLKSVFESSGPGWFGVKTGAVAQGEDAQESKSAAALVMEGLLARLNGVLEACLPASVAANSAANAAASTAADTSVSKKVNGTSQAAGAQKSNQNNTQQASKAPPRKDKPKPGRIEMPANPLMSTTASNASNNKNGGKTVVPKQEIITLE